MRGGVCGPFKKAESKLLCMTRGVRRRVSEKGFYVVGRGREEALSSISLEEVEEEEEEGKERTKETTGNREKTMSPPLGTLCKKSGRRGGGLRGDKLLLLFSLKPCPICSGTTKSLCLEFSNLRKCWNCVVRTVIF